MPSGLLFSRACAPSSVDHSVAACLSGPRALDLVLARGPILEIYAVARGESAGQLELVLSAELSGYIEGVCASRLPGSSRDTLLIACGPAKLSLVDYDPVSHTLVTRAVFSFDELTAGGAFEHGVPPLLRASPRAECALLAVHATSLLLIPLRPTSTATLAVAKAPEAEPDRAEELAALVAQRSAADGADAHVFEAHAEDDAS